MVLIQQIVSILSQNYSLEDYKDDKRIKSTTLRVLHEFIRLGILHVDENGKVMNKDIASLDSESNYFLLQVLESMIISLVFDALDEYLVQLIISVDYRGKCWYTPFEIAQILEKETGQRHNVRKIQRMLDTLAKEGHCIKMTDKQYTKYYRINFTLKVPSI